MLHSLTIFFVIIILTTKNIKISCSATNLIVFIELNIVKKVTIGIEM